MFAFVHPDWILLRFPFFFVAIWLIVSSMISLAGGWFALSKVYRDTNPPRKWQFMRESIYLVGLGSYGRCIRACVDSSGLRLSVLFIFRVMHPPLLIPISDIKSVTLKKWFFFNKYLIHLQHTSVTITVYRELGEAILKEWQAARKEDSAG